MDIKGFKFLAKGIPENVDLMNFEYDHVEENLACGEVVDIIEHSRAALKSYTDFQVRKIIEFADHVIFEAVTCEDGSILVLANDLVAFDPEQIDWYHWRRDCPADPDNLVALDLKQLDDLRPMSILPLIASLTRVAYEKEFSAAKGLVVVNSKDEILMAPIAEICHALALGHCAAALAFKDVDYSYTLGTRHAMMAAEAYGFHYGLGSNADMMAHMEIVFHKSRIAKENGRKAHANSAKSAAKAEALKLWNERRAGKHPKLRTNEQFATECMRRWPVLKSAKVVLGWCTTWNKQASRKPQPAS